MTSIRPLLPLLLAAGILLAGNGLQGTLIALRGQEEGFSTGLIGVIGAAYFAGFFFGCMTITQMLRAVGHIRAFAALAALAASGTLTLVLFLDPLLWVVVRFVIGFCFALMGRVAAQRLIARFPHPSVLIFLLRVTLLLSAVLLVGRVRCL